MIFTAPGPVDTWGNAGLKARDGTKKLDENIETVRFAQILESNLYKI